jgi:MerR family mercuric resistance operon transcriptional regulator
MRIGAVAAAANVNGQTLRYYEREGLLAAPVRAANGYREYTPDTVAVVRFIKRAQELGFSLEDARQLLALRGAPARNRLRARALVQSKLVDIERRLADLNALRGALNQLVANCCQTSNDRCPILEALDGSAPLRRRIPRGSKVTAP